MKKLENTYIQLLCIALSGGLLVFLFDFFGILIGGEVGRYLIYISKNIIVKTSTIIASLALFIGILHVYITKKHYLRIKD
jgi:hypothetical protein